MLHKTQQPIRPENYPDDVEHALESHGVTFINGKLIHFDVINQHHAQSPQFSSAATHGGRVLVSSASDHKIEKAVVDGNTVNIAGERAAILEATGADIIPRQQMRFDDIII